MLEKETLEQAAYEAIYWWNRNESYYHQYFSQIDQFYQNVEMLNFFISKIYSPFLREYSIRRNLKPGYDSIKIYLDAIQENSFFEEVANGNLLIIDEISSKVKNNGNGVINGTVSLLSKTAFLCNPSKFSLYDKYAKTSLKNIISKQNNKVKLDSYNDFVFACNEIIELNKYQILSTMPVLQDFSGSSAEIFFNSNSETYCRRVFDKYLWMTHNVQTDPSRKVLNKAYVDFYKLGIKK
jgi:hypothetical protein